MTSSRTANLRARSTPPASADFVKIDVPGFCDGRVAGFQARGRQGGLNFALRRDSGITGIVCLPNGKPAHGADVRLSHGRPRCVCGLASSIRLRISPKHRPDPTADSRSHGASGEFLVVAVTDTGYAEAASDELAKSGKLVLQAWGRIDGGVRIGALGSGPNQEVMFHPVRPEHEGSLDSFSFGYWMQTDERGRFQFDRVVPGPGTVVRVIRDDPRPLHPFRELECWPEDIVVKPGETAKVTLGGKGRPVIGRIVLDGTPEAPIHGL